MIGNSIVDNKKAFHYAWTIALIGVLVLFCSMGLARFSLGMLLPSMGTSLGWNYSQMRMVGTGNFIGYTLAILAAGVVTKKVGARWTIVSGLLLSGSSLSLMSRINGFGGITFLYTLTGIGSALAIIPMVGLISRWFSGASRGSVNGGVMSGAGLGIVLSGIAIPWINISSGTDGWRTSWLLIGLGSICITVLAAYFLRNHPTEKDLEPYGSNKGSNDGTGNFPRTVPSVKSRRWLAMYIGSFFFLFGTIYAVYATFMISEIVHTRGFDETAAGNLWAIIGALSILSGPLFGWLSDKYGRKIGLITGFGLLTFCFALVAFELPDSLLYASVCLFGLSLWSIPTIVTAMVGDYFGAEEAVKVLGITFFLGSIGQTVGPVLAGFVGDATGTFQAAFGACGLISVTGIILALFFRPSIPPIKK